MTTHKARRVLHNVKSGRKRIRNAKWQRTLERYKVSELRVEKIHKNAVDSYYAHEANLLEGISNITWISGPKRRKWYFLWMK